MPSPDLHPDLLRGTAQPLGGVPSQLTAPPAPAAPAWWSTRGAAAGFPPGRGPGPGAGLVLGWSAPAGSAPAPTRSTAARPAARTPLEDTINAITPASLAYAEAFTPEDDILIRARERARQLGCTPVGEGAGAALRVLAAALAARAVVEVGTGAGVGSLHLLRGMPADGVLTTIDVEVEHHRAARVAFAEEGLRSGRTRLITGRALDVMPRLTDGAYDLVLLDADKLEYAAYLTQALRLLRPGGVVAVDNSLWHNKVADPAVRDEETAAIREMLRAVRDSEELVAALLPVGDGLLVAVKR